MLLKLLPMCPDPARAIMYKAFTRHMSAKMAARVSRPRLALRILSNSEYGT
jgi:hypothetical protein